MQIWHLVSQSFAVTGPLGWFFDAYSSYLSVMLVSFEMTCKVDSPIG